jgi:DNA-binding CsgD family transcriptional regulator
VARNVMTSERNPLGQDDWLRVSRAAVAAAMRSNNSLLESKIYEYVRKRVPELKLNDHARARITIAAIVGYCLDAIEQGPGARVPIPQAALERARVAAREGSPIGPLLRAVEAGYKPFVDDVIAKAQGLSDTVPLREHLRETYGRLVGDVAAALEREYERERVTRAAAPRLSWAERNPVAVAALTRRQREVLELLCLDRSYKDVAQTLHLSINTVKTHASRLYRKLGVNGRDELVGRQW